MLGRWHSHTLQALANRGQSPREVWYWADEQVTLYTQTNVVSHTFADGMGKIRYNAPVVEMLTTLFGTPVTHVSLPRTVARFANQAFRGCSVLAAIDLPETLETIGISTFNSCYVLDIDSLPQHLKTINSYGFYRCRDLTLKELPPSIETIGDYAFRECQSLTEITFGGTPETISHTAFYSCPNLATIRVPWAEGAVSGAPWGATNATITYNYTP